MKKTIVLALTLIALQASAAGVNTLKVDYDDTHFNNNPGYSQENVNVGYDGADGAIYDADRTVEEENSSHQFNDNAEIHEFSGGGRR